MIPSSRFTIAPVLMTHAVRPDTGGILPRKIFFFAQTGKVLLKRIAGAMAETRYGDPIAQADVEMGPLINEAGLRKVVPARKADMIDLNLKALQAGKDYRG